MNPAGLLAAGLLSYYRRDWNLWVKKANLLQVDGISGLTETSHAQRRNAALEERPDLAGARKRNLTHQSPDGLTGAPGDGRGATV